MPSTMSMRSRSKDLFENSTMTFGQHLEELRTCLFKAVAGLFVGVLFGFAVGSPIVAFVASPLTAALEEYYQQRALKRATAIVEELQKEKKALPGTAAEIVQLVSKQKLLPEHYFIDPLTMLRQIDAAHPELLQGHKLPPAPPILAAKPDGQTAPQPSSMERNDLVSIFLWRPVEDDDRLRVKTLGASEAFSIYMKASMLAGVVLASPWIFYQLWLFIGAGLYAHEKRYVYIFLPFSVLLFLMGAGLTFGLVFKPVLRFFFLFNAAMGIEPDPRISEWISFVLTLPLGFGVAFQLPLVMLFLERIHVFTIQKYLSFWRVAVLVIAVIALLLTPDPSSMLLMVVPLVGLYFGGVALCRYMPKMGRPTDFEEEE